jgi:5'-deoxynucleotidase YfbR-like HD superfamily hydrolase
MPTDEEIIDEVIKIQYFYGLKKEIRYGETRNDVGESVAEHVYGMHILALYFLELEDQNHAWDRSKIYEMISWHDMDELETGDVIGYKKTEADKVREISALQSVMEKTPAIIKEKLSAVLDEYQKQESFESRFVKALDKLEPLFQVYNENGKEILLRNKTTMDDSRRIKDKYVEAFPYMKHFNDVLNRTMDKEGFFTHVA